jgi:TetR/AcrR family acrAB operon transcriptional repressor
MARTKATGPSRRMTEIGDESRQRLMDAALELFLEKGFENTTVVEIGQRAGISHGSIPWHFGNKSGLLYAVVLKLFESNSPAEALPTGQQGFNTLWQQQAFYDGTPEFALFGAFFLSEVEHSPARQAEVLAAHLERREIVIDWVNRSIQNDALTAKVSVEEIVEFWLGAARGIVTQKLVLGENFDLRVARHGLGVAVESLMGSNYFQNLDTSL